MMSLDTIYTTTIEMADALKAGDIELFYDLLHRRSQQVAALTPVEGNPPPSHLTERISVAEQEITLLLKERMAATAEGLDRLLVLRDAASEYTVQAPKRRILRAGLAG